MTVLDDTLLSLVGLVGALALFLFIAPFVWLMGSLADFRDRRFLLQDIIDEIDGAMSTFGFGAHKATSEVFRGVVTALEPGSSLSAPFSGRPCLAYRIEFGYPEDDGLVLLESDCNTASSVPLSLDGNTRVTLGERFRFSSADITQRREFVPNQIRPELRDELSFLFNRVERDKKRGWERGRFYEWILPSGAPCELVGTANREPIHYRSAGELELREARIHVSQDEDDKVLVDRLRRDRCIALKGIENVRRRRLLAFPIAIPAMAYAIWIFWTIFDELPRNGPP
jgi:hypothetical protein